MAIDFSKPALTDNYTSAFVPNLQANTTAVARLLDSGIESITGTIPSYVKRYNRSSSAFEEWSGSAWVGLPFQGITLASGNIGLGLTPAFKLDVLAAAASVANFKSSGNSAIIRFADSTADTGYVGSGSSLLAGLARTDFGMTAGAGGALVLGADNAAQARLTAVGLGLGVVPTEKLHVFGNSIRAADAAYSGYFGKGSALLSGGGVADLALLSVNGSLLLGTGSNVLRLTVDGTAGHVTPGADNAQTLGSAARRWAEVQALSFKDGSNGTFLTSSGTVAQVTPGSTWTAAAFYAGGSEGMRLDPGRNLLVGRTTSGGLGLLQLADATGNVADLASSASGASYVRVRNAGAFASVLALQNSVTGNGTGDGLRVYVDSIAAAYVAQEEAQPLYLSVAGTTRQIIFPGGGVLIGNGAVDTSTGPTYSGTFFGFDGGANKAILQAVNASTASLAFHVKPGAGSAPVERLGLLSDGRLYGTALHNNAAGLAGTSQQFIGSLRGSGLATVLGTNITAASCTSYHATRVGNTVVCVMLFSVTASAAGASSFRFALPIATTATSVQDAFGTLVANYFGSFAAGVVGGPDGSSRIDAAWVSPGSGTYSVHVTMAYEIE